MSLGRTGGRAAQATERAMPEESATPDLVELMHRAMESGAAWTADPGRSPGGLDAPLSFSGPDSVWDMSQLGMGELKGSEAIGAFFEEWSGAPYAVWDSTPSMAVAFEAWLSGMLKDWWSMWEDHDLGQGGIYVVAREDGRVKGSRGRVEQTSGWVMEWVNGLVVRITVYRNIDEARTAAERLAQERG